MNETVKIDSREKLNLVMTPYINGGSVTCLVVPGLAEELQLRVCTIPEKVKEYAIAIKAGAKLPPSLAVWIPSSNRLIVVDGIHTLNAHKEAGFVCVPMKIVAGNEQRALQLSASANFSHGVPRSVEDRRNVANALLDDPVMRGWSSNRLAKIAKISPQIVEAERDRRANALEKAGQAAANPATREYVRGGKIVKVRAPARDKQPDPEEVVRRMVNRFDTLTKELDVEIRHRIAEEIQQRLSAENA